MLSSCYCHLSQAPVAAEVPEKRQLLLARLPTQRHVGLSALDSVVESGKAPC